MLSLRRYLGKFPAVVALGKRLYRSKAIGNSGLFKKAVMRRAVAQNERASALIPSVSIETILTCNARCIMCVHSEKRMTGEMSMPVFCRLIDELAALGAKSVCLSVYGEPFLDRHWLERIEYVRKNNLQYTFFTNASLMKEPVLERMFELGGMDMVNFSVNGFSKESFELIMAPLKRDAVYANIDLFLAMKLRLGQGKPFVSVSSVQLNENAHELQDYVAYWKQRPGVDRVALADRGDWLGELKKTDKGLPAKGLGKNIESSIWLTPCTSLWDTLYVYADGKVAPCCEDAGMRKLIVGDVNTNTLREIFDGPAMAELRAMHLADQRRNHPICGKCRLNVPWI